MKDEGAGFGHDTNKVTILSRDGNIQSFGLKPKEEVAKDIIDVAFASIRNKKRDNEIFSILLSYTILIGVAYPAYSQQYRYPVTIPPR